jgi:hypothetical protein
MLSVRDAGEVAVSPESSDGRVLAAIELGKG